MDEPDIDSRLNALFESRGLAQEESILAMPPNRGLHVLEASSSGVCGRAQLYGTRTRSLC